MNKREQLYRDLNAAPKKIWWKNKNLYYRETIAGMFYFMYDDKDIQFWNGEGWFFNKFWELVDKRFIEIIE